MRVACGRLLPPWIFTCSMGGPCPQRERPAAVSYPPGDGVSEYNYNHSRFSRFLYLHILFTASHSFPQSWDMRTPMTTNALYPLYWHSSIRVGSRCTSLPHIFFHYEDRMNIFYFCQFFNHFYSLQNAHVHLCSSVFRPHPTTLFCFMPMVKLTHFETKLNSILDTSHVSDTLSFHAHFQHCEICAICAIS
jgi:hypothetical protein